MARGHPLLPALALAVAIGCGEVRRTVVDATLQPGLIEVQEVTPSRRLAQTFTPPLVPLAGVELLVTHHPKDRPVDLVVRVREGERVLGASSFTLWEYAPSFVRVTFPPVRAEATVTIEAWGPDARPGVAPSILATPIDRYTGGRLWVGDTPAAGDAVFRVLAPDTSRFALEPGLDFFPVQGRFPSADLSTVGALEQEFVVPMDSLVALEFMTGTGGAPHGPPLAWELQLGGQRIHAGTLSATPDNEPVTLTFPLMRAVEGIPLTLRLTPLGPGELRVWLCRRMPLTGALRTRDRMVDGSVVLRTLHLVPKADSLRVVLSSDDIPRAEPTQELVGPCTLTQTFEWPRDPSPRDEVGFRLALGRWTLPGWVAYEVRNHKTGELVHADSASLIGRGPNDYLWLRLGEGPRARRLSVVLRGPRTRGESAIRFWWVSAEVYPEGEALGCVPRPGGDCLFRLATVSPLGRWLAEFPRLSSAMAPSAGWAHGLLGARACVCAALALAVAIPRRKPRH